MTDWLTDEPAHSGSNGSAPVLCTSIIWVKYPLWFFVSYVQYTAVYTNQELLEKYDCN